MGEVRKCLCCGQPIPRGKLLCLTHRRRVPRDVWGRIRSTWRSYRQSPDGQPAIVAFGVYQRALEAAVAHATGQREEAA
jgi:hypothetical protein